MFLAAATQAFPSADNKLSTAPPYMDASGLSWCTPAFDSAFRVSSAGTDQYTLTGVLVVLPELPWSFFIDGVTLKCD